MSTQVIVKPIPVGKGSIVGFGYEALGYSFAPGTVRNKTVGKSPVTNKIDTGLEYEIPNPKFISEQKTPNQPKSILKREEMERKLHLKPGTLEVHSDFWKTYKVKLKNGVNPFDPSVPEEELALLVLKASGEVLPTLSDRTKSEYYQADFYIDDPEEEARVRKSEQDLELDAAIEFRGLGTEDKKRFSRILGILKNDKASDNLIGTELFEFIKTSSSNRAQFMRLINRSKETVAAEDEILQAMELSIIRKDGGRYYRFTSEGKKGQEIGVDIPSMINFITEPINADVRQELKELIKERKRKS